VWRLCRAELNQRMMIHDDMEIMMEEMILAFLLLRYCVSIQ
jgi:hypothetical protein